MAVRREKMKSHMEAAHRDGDFDVKTWIKCGLLVFRHIFHSFYDTKKVLYYMFTNYKNINCSMKMNGRLLLTQLKTK